MTRSSRSKSSRFVRAADAPLTSGPREAWLGGVLLACAVVFNVAGLAPEVLIERVPVNDLVFHRAAAERLGASLAAGEPFLEPWVSEWSLGYPVWRSYQPLPHLLAALVLGLAHPVAGPDAAFAVLSYLLVATLPVSVFAGARLLGLCPPAAGLAALLVFAPSATGEAGRWGLGYGAFLWRGSGLYTQAVALHFLALALGVTARTLDRRRRPTLAAALLALTALSHIVFGYVAFVSAALLALVGPRGARSERLARLVPIATAALALLAWFLVPLALGREIVNHSRWEDASKWDSYGARFVLGELLSGRLLDFSRAPVLTALLAAGVAGAVLCWRETVARRLLALAGLWLALFCGRETWGHLLLLAGVPADLHLHRLQAAFELSAVLLASFGVTRLLTMLLARARPLGLAAAALAAVAVVTIGVERARYLEENATWGEENMAAYKRESADLEAALTDVRAVLAERPGRVSAGPAAGWGGSFRIGDATMFSLLTRAHLDQTSFLFHAMSKTSDLMVLRNENDPAHDAAFAVRVVIAPAEQPMPRHLRRRAVHGRFAVYEASPEGYFGLADIAGHYVGPAATRYEPSASWLASPLLGRGLVISLDARAREGPALARWAPMPAPGPATPPPGRVLSETKAGEIYGARVRLDRPAHVVVKITWSPDLVATVDGGPAPLLHVTPGFGAVAVPAGEHEVSVRYRPGPLKPLLLVAGIGLVLWSARGRSTAALAHAERALSLRLDGFGARLAGPRAGAAATLVACAVVALHPLLRGKLVAGHDAAAYPPRLVEMEVALRDGHVPPLWAPDLSAGHGQPLFEFAPPLAYAAALPFRALGLRLTDSLQLGLALLFGVGAACFYRIGRRLGAGRPAAVAGAAAWLFAPCTSSDLFVRGAFAEAAALAALPAALLGVLYATERRSLLPLCAAAAAVALVPLGHGAVALLAIPALALVAVAGDGALLRRAVEPHPSARAGAVSVCAALGVIACGLGLAAWFWVPALLEKGLVHTDRLRARLPFTELFAEPAQLLWSPWGFGLSGPGARDGMSFMVGPVHLALALAGLVVAWRSSSPRSRSRAVAFAAAAGAGAWLSSSASGMAWSRMEAFQDLAYPWRALVLPGLFLPLLTVFAFERAGARWTAALGTLLVLFNLPHTEPRGYLDFDDEYYAPAALAAQGINTTTFEEYEPRWVETRPPYEPRALRGVTSPVEIISVSRRAARQELTVRAADKTTVESATFFYPGWTATVDGVETAVRPLPGRGTMVFELPAGEHRVVLRLGTTPARRAGRVATLLTLVLMGAASAGVGLLGRRRLENLLPQQRR